MHIADWDVLRVFLAVARTGRLVLAGRQLGLDHGTVSRRVDQLEKALGTRLFDRSPRGVALTDSGRALVVHAQRIETAVEEAGDIGERGRAVAGTVRLSTPEAFGASFIACHVAELRTRYPGLTLELIPATRALSLSRREADLAITFSRPAQGRLVSRRLLRYGLGLYASRDYLRKCGPIRSVTELTRHPFVGYIEEIIEFPELRSLLPVSESAAFRSSSILAQQQAVVHGSGLGLLHHFTAAPDARLAPVLPQEIQIQREYWLQRAADTVTAPRVRAVAGFLEDIVSRHRTQFLSPTH